MVVPYESGGKPFLFLPTWNEHQSVRAKKSKFPEPEVTCKQLQADESECPRNPIQSESNPIRNPNPNAHTRGADFETFWNAYPRKEGKEKARLAFEKADADLETLLSALEQHKKSPQWTKDGGQFIPYPATWLNGKRWEDQVCTSGKQDGKRKLDADEIEAIKRMMGTDSADEEVCT